MYLTYEDLKKGAYEETLRVLQREEANAETAITDAIGEIRPYLASLYNIDAEFAKTTARNELIVKFTRDIAIYNIYCISPNNMDDTRRLKYEDTIKFLEKAAKQIISISDLPRLEVPATGGNYGISGGSRPKRNNHY